MEAIGSTSTDLPRLAMPESSAGSVVVAAAAAAAAAAVKWLKEEGLSSGAEDREGPAVLVGGWGLRRPVSPSTSGTGATGDGAPSLARD